jgi:hypothetical protein
VRWGPGSHDRPSIGATRLVRLVRFGALDGKRRVWKLCETNQ